MPGCSHPLYGMKPCEVDMPGSLDVAIAWQFARIIRVMKFPRPDAIAGGDPKGVKAHASKFICHFFLCYLYYCIH